MFNPGPPFSSLLCLPECNPKKMMPRLKLQVEYTFHIPFGYHHFLGTVSISMKLSGGVNLMPDPKIPGSMDD